MSPRSLWQMMAQPDRKAITAAVGGLMPTASLALYSRWWQLETWLRSLAYVQLRSQYGVAWVDRLSTKATTRREKDRRREYMASPDWEDPLAYLDASDLFDLLEREWNLFEDSLIDRPTWSGRRGELLDIRNRIGHLRRPHPDDLGRLEQTLRDLDRGALRAVRAYQTLEAPNRDLEDPVVDAWTGGGHTDAQRLLEHAAKQYETVLRLRYAVMPWADPPREDEPISGREGVLWVASFQSRDQWFDIPQVWADSYLDTCARPVLVHLLVPHPARISFTIPAVERPDTVADAIGNAFDAALVGLSVVPRMYGSSYLDKLPAMDPRVQVYTPWSLIPDALGSSVFNA